MFAKKLLNGKTALVTGSTSGIGLGIAKALAAHGANVMLNGLGDDATIQRVRDEVSRGGSGAVDYNGADMQRPAEIEAMVAATVKRFGGLDIVVNNAGIQHVSPIEEFPTEKWDQIIAINLSSAFHTIRCAVPTMTQKGWGRIVNIASAHALVASPFKAAYVSAKHGIAGLTKTVALELAEKNITVNAICPGYVKTPLVENQIDDTARARGITREEVVRDVMLLAQPTKKLIPVEQVADLVLYLCSDAASAMTGSMLSIDGGWMAK